MPCPASVSMRSPGLLAESLRCWPKIRCARAHLHLAARRRGVGDGSELRCIHETIWRPEVHLVERIEEFAAYLKLHALGDAEFMDDGEVEGLHAGTVDGVAAHVPPEVNAGGVANTAGLNQRSAVCVPGPKNWL